MSLLPRILLPIATIFAAFSVVLAGNVPQFQGAISEFEAVRGCLERHLDTYRSSAQEMMDSASSLDAAPEFTARWMEVIMRDNSILEGQARQVIHSLSLREKNAQMDEIIEKLASASLEFDSLKAASERLVSACPVWAFGIFPDLQGEASPSGSLRGEFTALTRALLIEIARELKEVVAMQTDLRKQQQAFLGELIKMRAELASRDEELDAQIAGKRELAVVAAAGLSRDKDGPAMLRRCRNGLRSAVVDALNSLDDTDIGRLPGRLGSPLQFRPAEGSEAEGVLGPEYACEQYSQVRSVARGRIALASYFPGYGLTIAVLHSRHRVMIYSHLSASFVCVGDAVDAGQEIGLSGESGLALHPCLLFGQLIGSDIEDAWLRIDWPVH